MDVRHPAIVLGLSETGLGVVRALGEAGIATRGIDRRRRVGFRSRHVTAGLCPDPRHDLEAFVAHLLDLAARGPVPPVLFITADAFVAAVAAAWSRLLPHVLLLAPPPPTTAALLDKHRLDRFCTGHGFPAPRSVHATCPEDLDAAAGPLAFPVFVKPSTSATRGGAFPPPAKGAVANTPGELRDVVARATRAGGDVIVQEVVDGPDTQCYKYCALVGPGGSPLLEFTLQKIRTYPAHFGVGSCCVSRTEPEIVALGRRVFEAAGYRGVGSIEFKRDARDGAWKLIEVNARYWQQVALATRCGMNFPVAHYRAATGQAVPPAPAFAPGVTWLNVHMDVATCLAYQREGALTWSAWRESLQGPVVLSDLEWRDPWPALGCAAPWRTAGRSGLLLWRLLAG